MYRFKLAWLIMRESYLMLKEIRAVNKQAEKDIAAMIKKKPFLHVKSGGWLH